MNKSVASFANYMIANRLGIAVTSKISSDSQGVHLEITPVDLHPYEGFTIDFRPLWRSVEVHFKPGTFSGQLIARMGECGREAHNIFQTFVAAALTHDAKLAMRINGAPFDPLSNLPWPTNWQNLELALKVSPVEVDTTSDGQMEKFVSTLVVPLFGMLIALIGAEENILPISGEREGDAYQTMVTRYERSRINREACVLLKGCFCSVCGFDFARSYGSLGIGFIEVHHLESLASMNPSHVIDIATDLAPVCSNCHSMAHQRRPPVPLDELRSLVNGRL